jgi:hypothetical protein
VASSGHQALASAALLLFLASRSAKGEEAQAIPEVRACPGVGVGVIGLSLELNVEWRRWYVGAQGALATTTGTLGFAYFAGLRGGLFLAAENTAPFVGAGAGRMLLRSFADGSPSSDGWGVTAGTGIAFRRTSESFHPQLFAEFLIPFAQHTTTAISPGRPLTVFVGVRFLL